MSKPTNFSLGASIGLVMMLFSITFVYAVSENHEFTIPLDNFPFNIPHGVTTDSQDRILVGAPLSHKIFTYDSKGNLLSTITNNTINPVGLSVDTSGRIIVSDVNNDSVNVFNSAGVWQFTVNYPISNPFDVATDSNDRIIVVDSDTKETFVLDSFGNHERTLSHTNANDSPEGVSIDTDDRIIVADIGNKAVHVYDSDGNLEFSIDESTPGSPFIEPYRVTTDTNNRIIVADSNSGGSYGVFIYDSGGNFLHSIQDSSLDIDQISGITSDSNDRIIVSDKTNSNVKVFSVDYGVSSSDGCNSDCTPPSLESIEFNNTPNWLTAKNQTFNIGDKQEMKFVYYDNEGSDDIDNVKIGFGLPYQGSPMFNSEIILKINSYNGLFESLEIDDENKLFLENSTTVKIEQVQCGFYECLEYTLEFIWAEIPFDGYFLITASDDHRNTSYDRNEEPFTVIGKTLNDEPIVNMYNRYTSSLQDGLFIKLTRIDKVNDIWTDDKGEYWNGLGNDRFELVH